MTYLSQLLPCDILVTNIEEDEETLVIGGVGLVCVMHLADLLHTDQVNDVNVNLLGDRRRVQRVHNLVVLGPWAIVHIQIPGKTQNRR